MHQILGDRHNFGRSTYRTVVNGKTLIHKPRPVFWEWLFFGIDSPLKEALDQDLETLLAGIFKLDVSDPFSLHLGQVKEIERSNSIIDNVTFEKYAALTAYCTFWGISDLHESNLLKTDDLFLPVDIECVFMPIVLPNETGLLPHKNIPEDKCLFRKFEFLSQNTGVSQNFISRFAKTFLDLSQKNSAFSIALLKFADFIAECPVRILLRPTSLYAAALEAENLTAISDFLPEEVEQLIRGDIPYFFTKLSDQSVFFYSSDKFKTSKIANSSPVKIASLISNLDQLLNLSRQQQLFINSMLWLAKKIGNGSFSLADSTWNLQRTADQIELSFIDQKFIAKC